MNKTQPLCSRCLHSKEKKKKKYLYANIYNVVLGVIFEMKIFIEEVELRVNIKKMNRI